MGLFRRAKSFRKRSLLSEAIEPNFGHILSQQAEASSCYSSPRHKALGYEVDEESIGDELAPEDQFELEIPVKNKGPIGILRKSPSTDFQRRRCGGLSGPVSPSSANASQLRHYALDQMSSVSSISVDSYEFMKNRALLAQESPRINSIVNHQEKSSFACCGYSEKTADTEDSNSIVLQAGEATPRRNYLCWLCTPRESDALAEDQIAVRKPIEPRLRKTALFDDLEEDDPDDLDGEAATHVALVEGTRDGQTVASTVSSKRRLVPKFKLPKVRSFRRVISWCSKKSNKESKGQFVQPYDLISR